MVVIEIKEGKIRGTTGNDIRGGTFYSFQGIPYAEPPVGDLRFKAPKPVQPWSGIKDATEEGSESYSRDLLTRQIVGSEDCLNLNVYTPHILQNNKSNQLKPVMFWIHGGLFATGCNKTQLFGPEFLMTEDVVLVTINYRLGILGYLSLDDTSLGVPGNAGFKDMVLALKWVQRNIKQFSGDPHNVTVFGESAGAASAHLLMLSPMTKGLLHRVIAQSGSALNVWALGRRSAKQLCEEMGFYSSNDAELLEFLRNAPIQQILDIQTKLNSRDFVENDYRAFGLVLERPSSEEPFMTERPVDVIAAGNYNQVPLILGFNVNEGMAIDSVTPQKARKRFFENLELHIPLTWNIQRNSEVSKEIAQRIKRFYYGDVNISKECHLVEFAQLCTDTSFLREIYFSIRYHAKTSKCPVYLYRFSLETDLNIFKKLAKIDNIPGVHHADDLGYLFNTMFTPEIKPNSIEDIAQRRMTKLWGNFARFGNPTPSASELFNNVIWKPIQEDRIYFLDIGEQLSLQVDFEKERMAFWSQLVKEVNPKALSCKL